MNTAVFMLILAFIAYLAGSAILWNLNPGSWDESVRGLLVVSWAVSTLIHIVDKKLNAISVRPHFWIIPLLVAVLFTGSCAYERDASNTVFNEAKASTLLIRYEYFKNLASAIDKKRADILLYEHELEGGIPKEKDMREYYIQRRTELLGIIGVHNQLVSEYNAAMAKFNYNFTNAGDLPKSNLEPLPREFQNYTTKIK